MCRAAQLPAATPSRRWCSTSWRSSKSTEQTCRSIPGDRVVELPHEGNDTVRAAFSFSLNLPSTINVENLVLTGTANISATGNDGANVLTGNSGANLLDGLGGADTLIGGAGDDTYI